MRWYHRDNVKTNLKQMIKAVKVTLLKKLKSILTRPKIELNHIQKIDIVDPDNELVVSIWNDEIYVAPDYVLYIVDRNKDVISVTNDWMIGTELIGGERKLIFGGFDSRWFTYMPKSVFVFDLIAVIWFAKRIFEINGWL